MIENGFAYLALLVGVAGSLKLAEQRLRSRLFEFLPPIVLLYLAVMVLSTVGAWVRTDSVNTTYTLVKNNLLPAMIFLMLLKSDLRRIRKLGARMLGGFFAASFSIACGFIVAFMLVRTAVDSDAWMTFGALSGSWMGGTGNMVAVQQALGVADSRMGYALLIDSIDYALWVAMLLALVPFAQRFNRWTRSSTDELDRIGEKLGDDDDDGRGPDTTALLFLLGASLIIAALSQAIAAALPTTAFITTTSWIVIIVTVLGIAGAVTPLGRMAGSVELSSVMLYIIVALVGSRANLAELTQAPLYIAAGMIILAVHGSLMVLFAKLFRLDLFTCGVASLANIGGVASAPILAAAYSRVLIPVGVLMALLGYVIGTAGGLIVARILSLLA